MDELKNYEGYIEDGLKLMWEFLPNLITALIILVVGSWVIRIINRLVKRFFDKKDYDEALESFLMSFIKIGLKLLLFVLVITQLGVQSSSLVAMVGAAGLAVGLALSGTLKNFEGGVMFLVFKRYEFIIIRESI